MVLERVAGLQLCRSVARGWEATSFFVRFLYASKAGLKIVTMCVEEVAVDGIGTWYCCRVEVAD